MEAVSGLVDWPALALGVAIIAVGTTIVAVCARRRLRKLLAESKAREAELQTIITSEPACVKTVSRDLRLLTMNPAGLAAIEADSMEQVQGADLREVIHPDHLDDFIAMNDRVFQGESCFLRFRIIGLKGTVRWMETHAAPLRDADGRIASHLAVTHDISRRVEMERRLVEARDAAIAGTRAKSEFLANVSHEIRTPMTAILGWTEVLQHEIRSDPASLEKLAIIQRSGHHLLDLLNDILDLSRIEAGKASLNPSRFDPQDVLRDVRNTMVPQTDGRDLEFTVTAGPLPSSIRLDRMRLHQILVNLCHNALEFTEQGRVELRARMEPGPRIRFEIEDTGPGIPVDQLERVMDAFHQGDSSQSRKHGGVGLGLAISKGLAELLGGTLTLASPPGKGTIATLEVPLRAEDAAPVREPATAGAPTAGTPTAGGDEPPVQLRGARILLADDGYEHQRVLLHLLRRAGCRAEVACNGRDAIELVETAARDAEPLDLILMDVEMPELDGHSATRALRARGIETPIIALTAHAMRGDRERAIEAGCDDYLSKPIRAVDLFATLDRHLRR